MKKTVDNIIGIKFLKRKLAKFIKYKNYFWIKINPIKEFPAFSPGHQGELPLLSQITFESINNSKEKENISNLQNLFN